MGKEAHGKSGSPDDDSHQEEDARLDRFVRKGSNNVMFRNYIQGGVAWGLKEKNPATSEGAR